MLNPVRLQRFLTTDVCGRRLIQLAIADSTNRILMHWIRQGQTLPEGTTLVATQQRAGVGQQGKFWLSPPGGLYLSLALFPPTPVQQAQTLTLALVWGIALQLRRYWGSNIQLKWPNDLVSDGHKLAGLLIHSRSGPDHTLQSVVVGFGLNVNNPVPENATSLSILTGSRLDLTEVAAIVLQGLETGYDTWQRNGLESILPDYERWMTHKATTVICNAQPGTVLGVNSSGELCVQTPSGLAQCQPGEVHLGYS